MRLPLDSIDVKGVAASKPQALGMVANRRIRAGKSQYANNIKEVKP
jgi:hypothetical protein